MTREPWQGRLRLVAAAAVYAVAAIVLLLTGTTEIRYSADHARTIPVWHVWLPALVAVILIRVIPLHLPRINPLEKLPPGRIRREGAVCLGAAVVFAAALVLGGALVTDAWYVGLKIGLLVVVPSMALGDSWLIGLLQRPPTLGPWYWLGPAVGVGAWLALAYVGPFARPSSAEAAAVTLIALFVLNAVVEEVFYRVWLQTRLELLIGRWAAIACVALLWAAWHVALQGTGDAAIDLATVVAHQGVLGLMLGYLWSRYRNPWALFVVHGAVNAPLGLLAGII